MRKVFRSTPEYVTGVFTETDGKDIGACPVQVGLSDNANEQPATWKDPDRLERPTPASARASLLVDDSTPPGIYTLWVKVVDSPETLARPARNEMVQVV